MKEELIGRRIGEIAAGVTSCASLTPQRVERSEARARCGLDVLVVQGTVVS